MKFKHMLFVLTVTTSIIFACMLGSSYAYYTLSNGTTVTEQLENLMQMFQLYLVKVNI